MEHYLRRFAALFAALAITHATLAQTQASAHPAPPVAAALREQPLLLGTAWYPEQWPETRWDADLTLMQKAGMHVVRVGEFAWSTMEPAEGHFEFTWLDHAIALAARHDIKVVLGTPTAAPPAWLTEHYPDTLRFEEDGHRAEHGNRAQGSFTSPTYRRFAARIAEEMAKRYGHNANVLGWQLDNELSALSFDGTTRADFHGWLKARYATVAELNRRWVTAYWSQTYDSFDQVPVHSRDENPALLLDWKRFVTDTWSSYAENQIAAMRPHLAASQWITTNTMGWFNGFDHYKLHTALDLAAWDDYVGDGHLDPIRNGTTHDLVRGFKQGNFWVMETQPAFVNWNSVNTALARGVTREMAWQAVGHGADAVLYWQWRSALNGQEEYHGTLLGADGTPVPVYDEIKKLGADFASAGPALAGTQVHAPVAVLQDYDSHWAIDFQKHTNRFDYVAQIMDVYQAMAPGEGGGAPALDLLSPLAELSAYKVVVAPALNVLPEATARHLLDYVRNGGLLVLGPRSGMKDGDNGLNPQRQPGPLAEALGARVAQFYALDREVAVQGGGVKSGMASVWAEPLERLSPDTQTLLTFGPWNGWLDGQPAAVRHSFGKGAIVYVGAVLDVPTLRGLLLPMLAERGVRPLLPNLPPYVELMERSGAGRRVWILVNHGEAPARIDLGRAGRNLLENSAAPKPFLDLAPHGVAVVPIEGSPVP